MDGRLVSLFNYCDLIVARQFTHHLNICQVMLMRSLAYQKYRICWIQMDCSPFSVLTTKVCILQIGQLNKEFVNFIQI